MKLTGKQNSVYRPLVNAAWKQYCARNTELYVGDAAAKRTWYERQLVEAIAVKSTSEARWTPRLFDDLCRYFATRSGDDRAIEYWSRCEERRICWVIGKMLEELEYPKAYAEGIARKMGLLQGEVTCLNEMPEDHLRRVAVALNAAGKRHLNRDIWKEICGRVGLSDLPADSEEDLSAELVCEPEAEALPF